MWKLIVGNPLLAIIIFTVIFGLGTSSGIYFQGLRSDKVISSLKLDQKAVELKLSNNLVEAQQKLIITERASEHDAITRREEFTQQKTELEKQHDSDKQALAKIKARGGGNTLSRDAVIAWLHDNPGVANNDQHVPATPGDTTGTPAPRTACTESDLLADRNGWKELAENRRTSLTLCINTLKDWRSRYNRDNK